MQKMIFEYVPHDVLQYVLAPMMDTESMIHYNMANHPYERVYRRFPKDYVESHNVYVMVKKFYSMLYRVNDENKIKIMYNIFKELSKPISQSLYKYNKGFYKVYLEKCKEYKKPSSIQYTRISDSWKKSFIKISSKCLDIIEKNPYVKELQIVDEYYSKMY